MDEALMMLWWSLLWSIKIKCPEPTPESAPECLKGKLQVFPNFLSNPRLSTFRLRSFSASVPKPLSCPNPGMLTEGSKETSHDKPFHLVSCSPLWETICSIVYPRSSKQARQSKAKQSKQESKSKGTASQSKTSKTARAKELHGGCDIR